jgi:DNA modification methylase
MSAAAAAPAPMRSLDDLTAEHPLLLNGDCLELMKTLPDKSVDIFICDLPYGETNLAWDTRIDLAEFWRQFKRLRKSKRTACIHFCSTGFGYTLIKSWERGFKMDMVWKKRNKTGGLQSRFRPMRNHEMVYFFYEQSPKYNRDKYHKRIKSVPMSVSAHNATLPEQETKWRVKDIGQNASFEPKQPASVLEGEPTVYGATKADPGWWAHNSFKGNENPASVLEEQDIQRRIGTKGGASEKEHIYTPEQIKKYREEVGAFDTPTPASVVEEVQGAEYWARQPSGDKTGHGWDKTHMNTARVPSFEPVLPPSVLEDNSLDCFDFCEGDAPHTVFESGKCFFGKRWHQTSKPLDILEFFLKYWSDPDDVILDPTFGGGSTGVACKKMGRKFIGCEMDDAYFRDGSARIIATTAAVPPATPPAAASPHSPSASP